MAYDYDRTRLAARPIAIDKFDLMVLAEKIVRELPRHLKTLGRDKDSWDSPLVSLRGFGGWHFTLGDFEVKDVRGQTVKVPVYVAALGTASMGARHWIAGGEIYLRYDPDAGVSRKSYMMVRISGLATINGLLANLAAVGKEVYSVLIHETTHLRDHLPARGPAKDKDPEPSEREYYNLPHEVRAFMQQTVDEVLEYAEAQARSIGVGGRGIDLTSRFIERGLESSTTWQRMQSHLDAANDKLIRRAVARALRDEWPRLEKQYPG